MEEVRTLIQAGPDWLELDRLTKHHQVLPQIFRGLRANKDLLSAAVLESYQRMDAANTLRNLCLEKELDRILAVLSQSEVSCVPLKGPRLALESYGDVALRVFSDLDIYLHQNNVQLAIKSLINEGYKLTLELPPSRWESFERIANQISLTHRERGWLVELHWRILNPLYALDLDAHLSSPKGEALTDEEMLVVLSVHGAKHIWDKLKWVVDIDRFIKSSDTLDWQATLSLAEAAGCMRMFLLGMQLAESYCGTKLPALVSDRLSADTALHGLAIRVAEQTFSDLFGCRRFVVEYCYHLTVRERWSDRLRLSWRWPLWPRSEDWQVYPEGDRFFVVYLVGRLVRVLRKWGVKASPERAVH
ncbi:MAG: hypothetical protein C0614_13895 [Desulfuromonas sp.]|nr:MAG: hypothetical protein C0614_13895 [Desulfuromonas sp.]